MLEILLDMWLAIDYIIGNSIGELTGNFMGYYTWQVLEGLLDNVTGNIITNAIGYLLDLKYEIMKLE